MDTNSFVLYSNVTEVYDKLIHFCMDNGFKLKENNEKFFFITGKKTSLLFWQNLRLELKILAEGKQKVEVNVMVYKYGNRKSALENGYRIVIIFNSNRRFFQNKREVFFPVIKKNLSLFSFSLNPLTIQK